jgi:hypothetical protein
MDLAGGVIAGGLARGWPGNPGSLARYRAASRTSRPAPAPAGSWPASRAGASGDSRLRVVSSCEDPGVAHRMAVPAELGGEGVAGQHAAPAQDAVPGGAGGRQQRDDISLGSRPRPGGRPRPG